MQFMAEKGRKKLRVTGFVSPHTKEIIKRAVKDKLYGSESDFVSEAVVIRANQIYELYYRKEKQENKKE